jgi:hypothetical protein
MLRARFVWRRSFLPLTLTLGPASAPEPCLSIWPRVWRSPLTTVPSSRRTPAIPVVQDKALG